MNYDGADYFFLKNHLGSITEITDIYQNTVKTYDYDAFGNILGEDGSRAHNAFTYTAREYHPRSGLYYYRARFYDPEIGRFITQDPIGFLGGLNLYVYVLNDPINLADPLGWMSLRDAITTFVPPVLNFTLSLYSPNVAKFVGGLEFIGAGILFYEEYKYQQSRMRLEAAIEAADLSPEQKCKYRQGSPWLSEAGYTGAGFVFNGLIAFRVGNLQPTFINMLSQLKP